MVGGTRNRSGSGGSPSSSDDTPVCSVIGATETPAVISEVTISVVNGRPALGISALPGSRANTVWYAEIGHWPWHVGVGDRAAVPREVCLDPAFDVDARPPQARQSAIRRAQRAA